jgi:hypothetical protein
VAAAAVIDERLLLGVRPGSCVAAVPAVIDEGPVAVGVFLRLVCFHYKR